MNQLKKSLSQLRKVISESPRLNENSINLLSLLEIKDRELQEIREKEKNTDLIHIDEFWNLTEVLYTKFILKTIKEDLFNFFKKILLDHTSKVLEVNFQFFPWNQFSLFVNDLHDNYSIDKADFYTNPNHIENQLQNLIDYFNIKDSNWKDHLYDFDYSFNFQTEVEKIFLTIAFSCWQKAKKETGSNVVGLIRELNGGSYIYDLDTETNLNEMNLTVLQYIDTKK